MQTLNQAMTVTFLGTGTSTGVPVVACDCEVCKSNDQRDKRLRTSVMIKTGDKTFIIDCGPDFRYQMIRANVDNIDAIIFTHEHRDHIAGLDDVRGFNYVLNKNIEVYANASVIKAIYVEFPYILSEDRYFSAPQLNFHEIGNQEFQVQGIDFMPVKVRHDKMEVFGYRIGDFTYITDACQISDEEKLKLTDSKVLVINALRNSKHAAHYCLKEALELIREIKPQQAYLTHMSHFIGLHQEVEKKLPHHVHLAYDGLSITV